MKLPLLPTAFVLVGVPFLVHLGVWQLDRREEKRAELMAFAQPADREVACVAAAPVEQRGGRNREGRTGYSHFLRCRGMENLRVDLGWTRAPADIPPPPPPYRGKFYMVPDRGALLVVSDPEPPLGPSALPDVSEIPNNHLIYAVQWFSFAAILPVIYLLWLRRWRGETAR